MYRKLVISMILAFSVDAFATGGYTAIAYDPYQGVAAQSSHGGGFFDATSAKNYAVQRCQTMTSNCIVIQVTNGSGWISLANLPGYPGTYAFGMGADQATSDGQALNACAQLSSGQNCQIVVDGYSFP
jgi:hypothetical protein